MYKLKYLSELNQKSKLWFTTNASYSLLGLRLTSSILYVCQYSVSLSFILLSLCCIYRPLYSWIGLLLHVISLSLLSLFLFIAVTQIVLILYCLDNKQCRHYLCANLCLFYDNHFLRETLQGVTSIVKIYCPLQTILSNSITVTSFYFTFCIAWCGDQSEPCTQNNPVFITYHSSKMNHVFFHLFNALELFQLTYTLPCH